MSYRIGKEYIKMKCPLCHSVYLLLPNEICTEEIKEDPDPDDPNDDGTRYLYGFYCEDCNRQMRNGKFLGREIFTDAEIKELVRQMKVLK
jgi:hypothetical protein